MNSAQLLPLLLVKITLILLAVWIIYGALAKWNPRWQVWTIRIGVCGIGVLLITAITPPLLHLPILTSSAIQSTQTQPASLPSPTTASAQPLPTQLTLPQVPIQSASEPQPAAMAPSAPRAIERIPNLPDAPHQSNTSTATNISWPAIAWIVWAIGVSFGLIRWLLGYIGLRQIIARATPASESILLAASPIAASLNIATPRILMSDAISTPSVVGVRHPIVLLSSRNDHLLSGWDLQSALAHEFAHIAGNDLRWGGAVDLLSILLWPHPFLWPISTGHRAACERTSDLTAAELLQDRGNYASSLVKIATKVQRVPQYGMSMARSSKIMARLNAIASDLTAVRLGRKGKLAAVMAICSVIAVGTTALVDIQKAIAKDTEPAAKTMTFTVLNAKDDSPLANANVEFRFWNEKTKNAKQAVATGPDGIAVFNYPQVEGKSYLRIMTKLPGHVPYYVDYDSQPFDLLPTTKTIRMADGVKVGGIIVDEAGKPITDAEISIHVPAIDPPKQNYVYNLIDEKTHSDGRWLLDGAPEPAQELNLRVQHPRFKAAWFKVQPGVDATYEMKRGWSIRGTVTDSDGKPVSGAKIITGHDRFGSSNAEITTDSTGAYAAYGLDKEDTKVTIIADVYAPQMIDVVPDNTDQSVADFKLTAGNHIEFHFVDLSGKPIPNASIAADTWRSARTLAWRSKSDDAGHLSWDGAPDDAVIYDAFASGYRSSRQMPFVARAEPYIVTLAPEYTVNGEVTDADSGQPIAEFEAQFLSGGPNGVDRSVLETISGRSGKFSLSYNETQTHLYVQVKAAGYEPFVTTRLDLNQPAPNLKIALRKGTGPRGVVSLPDGSSASNASVYLGTEGNMFSFSQGFRTDRAVAKAITSADGSFELPVLDPNTSGLLAIVHDGGYAEVTLDQLRDNPNVKLEQWASVSVDVQFDGFPAANQRVHFEPRFDRSRDLRVFSYDMEADTDANGHAELKRIIPRPGHISLVVVQPHYSGSTNYPDRGFVISPQPGQSLNFKFGGSGRGVTGQISLPPNLNIAHKWSQNEAGEIKTAGLEWDNPNFRNYRFLIADSGYFRVPNLPIGKYELSVGISALPTPTQCGTGARIGEVPKHFFEVTNDSQSDLDLGTVLGKWDKRKGAGERAENFLAQTRSGTLTLDQYAGKLVLLDFWATWCAPCLAEMPEVQKLYERFQSNDRFAMIGMSLDTKLEDAIAMADERKWPWQIALCNGGTMSLPCRAFEVREVPVKILIGPDGIILYRGQDLTELASIIQAQLANMDPSTDPGIYKLKPQAANDDFKEADAACEKVIALAAPYRRPEADANAPVDQGLFLYDKDGRLIRNITEMTPAGWLTHADRLAIDHTRSHVYVAQEDTLHCVSTRGRHLFDVAMRGIQSVAVDPDTGNLWCIALSYMEAGCTIILDADGHELRRLPLAGFTLKYSQADKGFWYVGKEAKLVSTDGTVLASHSLPSGAYTFAALAIDPQGGAWALESSHPDVHASHEQLWRITSQSMQRVGDFGKIDFNTNVGAHLRALAATADGVWVEVVVSTVEKDPSPTRTYRLYDRDGKLAAEQKGDQHDHLLSNDSSSAVWTLSNGEFKTLLLSDTLKSFIGPRPTPPLVYQPIWFAE